MIEEETKAKRRSPVVTIVFVIISITVVMQIIGMVSRQNKKPAKADAPDRPQPASVTYSDFREDRVGIDMVFVKGGAFIMGCTDEQRGDCYGDEEPACSVTVSNFYIGKYTVTQKQWKEVMDGANPSHFIGDDLPVERINWNDAMKFIIRLNSITGKKYRMPTEAEWEYAARGGASGKGHKYPGSGNLDDVAWYHKNSGEKTHPVGGKQANELGIHDMSGNVWEWVNDWYGEYKSYPQTDPKGPSGGSSRVVRGGGWGHEARNCRVSDRSYDSPNLRNSNLGFRLALSP